jgi:hypothetical protein
MGDGFDSALGQHGAQGEGHIGGVPDFIDGRADYVRKVLPAVLFRGGQRGPAAFLELPIRIGKTRRFLHPVLPGAYLGYHRPVERRQYAGTQAARLAQDGRDQLAVDILKLGARAQLLKSDQSLQHEFGVAVRMGITTHCYFPHSLVRQAAPPLPIAPYWVMNQNGHYLKTRDGIKQG